MNGIWLLIGLLVMAYTGSMLVGGRALRGYGLPSGVEYLLLGFVLGPHVLDLAPRQLILSFEPLLLAALGWLAAVVGVDYGVVGTRTTSRGTVALGVLLSLVVSAGVFASVYIAGGLIEGPHQTALLPLALILAICLSETTRHAIRWVVERHAAEGPVSTLLADVADTDDALPLLATAVAVALAPSALPWGIAVSVGVTLGAGVLLGVTTALLLGKQFRRDETWGLMMGAALLGIGLSTMLHLSPLALMFSFGVTLVAVSRHRTELRVMVGASERPVLLPVLLLAGALIDLRMSWQIGVLIAIAVAVRVLMRVASGWGLLVVSKPARALGPWIGLTTVSSGALALGIGVLFFATFPGEIGAAALTAAAASALVGELIGPTALRRGLARAGEIRLEAPVEPVEPAADIGADPTPNGAAPVPAPSVELPEGKMP